MPAVRHLLLLIASILVFAGIFGCGSEPEERAPVVRPVKMLTVGTGSGGSLEYPGEVRAAQDAEVSFEIPGRIVELAVMEGQEISRGDLIARLDPTDFETARDREQAMVNASRAEYERYQELYASNAVSLSDLETKRRNFEVAETNLRAAQKTLDDTRLLAPFAGSVGKRLVENFENVQAKQPIVFLQDESSLEVVVQIPERDWAMARPNIDEKERTRGAQPVVVISSFPDRQFPAAVKEFSTTSDPVTRTYEVRLAFDPPGDIVIRPGMTARAIVTGAADLEAAQDMRVPSVAVIADDQKQSFVWKVKADDTVTKQPVTVGPLSGSEIVITGGLENGDRIAISGITALREGMQVRELE